MSEQLHPIQTESPSREQDPLVAGDTEEMPTHELLPDTEEMPTREMAPPDTGDTFIYHDAEFVRLDKDDDTFAQLEAAAGEDNPGMVGLEWIEADGLRYRVSSHEKLTRVNHAAKKTLLPRLSIHKVKGPALRRAEVHEPFTEEVDYRTVDVLNENGDIVDIKTFVGYRREWVPTDKMGGILLERATGEPQGEYRVIDNFKDYFYVGANINPASPGARIRMPRDIRGVRQVEQESSEINAQGTVPAPEIADWDPEVRRNPKSPKDMEPKTPKVKTQELFEAVAQQQDDLELDDWRGLTWNTPFPRIRSKDRQVWERSRPDQMQIIRDTVIIRNASDPDISYPERVFEVRTTSADGITKNRHIYTVAELMEQFSRREAREREVHRLRTTEFNLPSEMDWFTLHALYERLGDIDQRGAPLDLHWVTPDRSGEERGGKQKGTDVTLDQLYEMMLYPEHYPDTQEGRAALQQHINLFKEKAAHGHERVSRIQAALAEQGLSHERFMEIMTGLRDGYAADLRRLGIKIPEGHEGKEDSCTWLLHDMEKQLAAGVDTIFEDSREGHKLRAALVNRRLGHRFKDDAIKIEKARKRKGDEDAQEEKISVLNRPAMRRIRTLLYEKAIKATLGVTENNGRLEFKPPQEIDLERLGELIRLSLGET